MNWYKASASKMINGHIAEISESANAQVQTINNSAAKNSKWIAQSYDGTIAKIEKERKKTILEIKNSKIQEKANVHKKKTEQLIELEKGTSSRVKNVKIEGERIAEAVEKNGFSQYLRILIYKSKAEDTFDAYIDDRVKHHNVKSREGRMRDRLTSIKANGMESITEATDELLEKVIEQTTELAARIRKEYLAVAKALPEEKDNIREAIIDAAEAAIEGIEEIDITTPIIQLNATINLLIAQLRKEKAEVLATIENARSTSIKEIRDEESQRLAEYR